MSLWAKWSAVVFFVSSMGCTLTAYAQQTITTTTSAPTVQEVIKYTDTLATKSDRWLFLAALLCLLATGALIIFWLTKQLDKQRDANQSITDRYMNHLEKLANEKTS